MRDLSKVSGATQTQDRSLMMLSGTSVAAPVVSGAVALMLEANAGLTPPMVKAILQYTAQVLPNANLAQQGAGLLNVDGAVRLAAAIRNDMYRRVVTDGGSIPAGESLLWWSGATLPAPSSVINGETVPWGRLVFAGGNRIVTGEALFKQWQPWYDPRIQWVRKSVKKLTVRYWPNTSNTYPMAVMSAPAPNMSLMTPGVVSMVELAGTSSLHRQDRSVHPGGDAVVVAVQRQDAGAGHRDQRRHRHQRRHRDQRGHRHQRRAGDQRGPGDQRRHRHQRGPGHQRSRHHQPEQPAREAGEPANPEPSAATTSATRGRIACRSAPLSFVVGVTLPPDTPLAQAPTPALHCLGALWRGSPGLGRAERGAGGTPRPGGRSTRTTRSDRRCPHRKPDPSPKACIR